MGETHRITHPQQAKNQSVKPGLKTLPVIPNHPTQNRLHPFDEPAARARNAVAQMVYRLQDRRIPTRADKLATNDASPVAITVVVMGGTRTSLVPSF